MYLVVTRVIVFCASVSMRSVSICRVFLVHRLPVRMFSSKITYEDAVHKLNLLQSNKSTIEQIRKDIRTGQKCKNLEDMKNYLQRTGISLSMLDQLSVIHVAGTKGKGSTSAMCESILRTHGFRTGFYSSPHLVEVRERIRLDGSMLTRSQFTEHFCKVYNALYDTQRFEGDMPKYFAFLTVLAFNVFLKDRVDVAVVEVGIGGIVDYTNILRKVPVVGITALGLDHTSILGTTLPEIAAAKAGIMKRGCEAYTVKQPPEAMDVLRTVASNVGCTLNVVPDFNMYKFQNGCKLSISLEAYQMNASLAIQVSHAWMRLAKQNISYIIQKQVNGNSITEYMESNNIVVGNEASILVNTLTKETVLGLKECNWPGRYHVIKSDYAQFYLDGAHTKESMEICAKWFIENNRHQAKVLIFSATGDRDAEVLLKPLKDISFETVFFVIPTAYKEVTKTSDNYSSMEHKELLSRCKNHSKLWENLNGKSKIFVLQCVADALMTIKNNYSNTTVLITGSLHLVGAALSLIDPNMSKGARPTGSMHMWMWFGYDLGEFLFSGLTINTRWAFALTWIALFFVALMFEGSKVYLAGVQREAHKKLNPFRCDERRNLLCDRERGNPMEPTTSRNASSGQVSRWASFRVRTLVNGHQTLVFIIHNVVGYLLMLAVMVYNVHLLLAVVFGMMLGYFLFGTKLTRLQMQCFGTKRVVICTPECDDTAENTTPPLLDSSQNSESDFFICRTRNCIQPSHYFPTSPETGESSGATCFYGAKMCPSKVARAKKVQAGTSSCHHESEKEDSPSVEDAQLLRPHGCCKKKETQTEEKCCKSSHIVAVVHDEKQSDLDSEEKVEPSREESPQVTCCHNAKLASGSQEQIIK